MLVGIETLVTSLLFLSFFGLDISLANILYDIPKNNPLHINWYPAPSPENGPPISRNASRNKALLPLQISGIVGAYLICVCIVGIALFFIGKKRTRDFEIAEKALDIELEMRESRVLAPINTSPYPQAPLSPLRSPRNFSRPSWPAQEKNFENHQTPYVFPGRATSPRSPVSNYSPQTPVGSIGNPNVDARIMERDQHMLQRDLEDIYAHVMEQDEAKAKGIDVGTLPLPPHIQAAGPVPGPAAQQQRNIDSSSPPVKKIEKRRPSNMNLSEEKPRSRSSSIISALMSPRKSKAPKMPMQISSPIASPALYSRFDTKAIEEDAEPLAPRYYAPAPPPPVPTDQVPSYHTRQTSDLKSPTRTIAERLGPGPPVSFPMRNPSQNSNSSAYPHRQNPSQTSFSSQTRDHQPEPSSAISATSTTPFAKAPSPGPTPIQASTSTRALPFRQFEPALTSPSYSSFAQSTKTTVLERSDRQNGPRTGGLGTPFSAGAVPYSPYQPFSPMMPITPRLVTKEERKMKEKMMRKALGSPVPKEMVKSSDELWDSGY